MPLGASNPGPLGAPDPQPLSAPDPLPLSAPVPQLLNDTSAVLAPAVQIPPTLALRPEIPIEQPLVSQTLRDSNQLAPSSDKRIIDAPAAPDTAGVPSSHNSMEDAANFGYDVPGNKATSTSRATAPSTGTEPFKDADIASPAVHHESAGQDRALRVRPAKPILKMWLPKTGQVFLQEASDSESWQHFIQDWFKFECEIGLTNTTSVSLFGALINHSNIMLSIQHRLPNSSLRPSAVSTWVQKRNYSQIPAGAETDGFATEWITWWNAIQPEWRRSDKPDCFPLPLSKAEGSNNLNSLKKTGPCGLALVVFSLAWWGPQRSSDSRWQIAVDDMHACIKWYMNLDSPTAGCPGEGSKGRSTKRKGRGASSGGAKKRRTT